VCLDAITRGGGVPELTQRDVGLAAAGLPQITFWVALYSLAGDDSNRGSLRHWLLEKLLEEREARQWATKVERRDGGRAKFAEQLCDLYLLEERRPAPFQAVPNLRAAALEVEPAVWTRAISHQYAFLHALYHDHLIRAADHVRRKLKKGLDG
jgi:hypothetical protein